MGEIVDKQKIIRLYKEEKISCAKIAEKFGCCGETIRRKLKKWNVERRSFSEASYKVFDKSDLDRLVSMNRKGMSIFGISKKENCSEKAVKRVFYKYGVEIQRNPNTWNKGLTKENEKLRKTANKISKSIREKGLDFNSPDTKEETLKHLKRSARGLRERESDKYEKLLNNLDSWVSEYVCEDFLYKTDGEWKGYIVDLAKPSEKIIVELDGEDHKKPSAKEEDRNRDNMIESYGWNVKRIDQSKDDKEILNQIIKWENKHA